MGAPPSEYPPVYWNPLLGHFCHVTVESVGRLTPGQLYDSARIAKKLAGGGR